MEEQTQQEEEKKPNDKELNFRRLEHKYERMLAEERSEREKLKKQIDEISVKATPEEEDEDPYVDQKKLQKTLHKFGDNYKKETQSEIQKAVTKALDEERKNGWLKNHPDFYDTMQHAEKIPEKDPELAETILSMPEGFDRQKMVYRYIKNLGLDQPPKKESTIQDKIEQNRKSPYYQPSGLANAPYQSQGDFSPQGQKQAYEQLQALKKRLRLS